MFREYAYQQTERAECGLACIAASAAILGDKTDLSTLRRKFPVSRGLSLKHLHEIAASMGLNARSVKCDPEELSDLRTPAILHFGMTHFVVLERASRRKVMIFDPAWGRRSISYNELKAKFTGIATEITTTPTFKKRRGPAPLKLMNLVTWSPPVFSGLAQIFILSILLQLYLLASPYFMQLAIDEAALKGDKHFLLILSIGFGIFALFNVVATAIRAAVMQRVNLFLSWDMTQGVFHRLIRLPLPWFQRRKLADVLTRFQALDPIKSLISGGLIPSLIDGVLSIVTLSVLFIYNSTLAFLSLASLTFYVALRLIGIPISRNYASRVMMASIAEQGKRIETLRSMQTVKIMGAEVSRENDWLNKFAATVGASQKNALVNIIFSSLHDITTQLSNVVVIGFGTLSVIDGKMSIGMLYAFTAYQTQFLTRASGLFEQVAAWRMLDLYTFRIADIVLTPVEEGIDTENHQAPEMVGKVTLEDVSFKYSVADRHVIRHLSFSIQPGEFIAITGASGLGKSTLLKLIAGLYVPNEGEIKIDDLSLSYWGPRVLRRSIGMVLQDDELLSGSITENVSFFDENCSLDRVWECLHIARIDSEIGRMAMGLDTLMGDMGSTLSGGQKQRILLARALYRKPKILILDEATAHLDVKMEREIGDNLAAMDITRIISAHRPNTIAAADRVFDLSTGSWV